MIAHQYYSHMCLCNLIRNAKKNRPFQVQAKVKFLHQFFEDHRLGRTDLTVIHDSPLTGTGPDVTPFRKFEDYELSEKVFVLESCH